VREKAPCSDDSSELELRKQLRRGMVWDAGMQAECLYIRSRRDLLIANHVFANSPLQPHIGGNLCIPGFNIEGLLQRAAGTATPVEIFWACLCHTVRAKATSRVPLSTTRLHRYFHSEAFFKLQEYCFIVISSGCRYRAGFSHISWQYTLGC
jgi:hypothetical protein